MGVLGVVGRASRRLSADPPGIQLSLIALLFADDAGGKWTGAGGGSPSARQLNQQWANLLAELAQAHYAIFAVGREFDVMGLLADRALNLGVEICFRLEGARERAVL